MRLSHRTRTVLVPVFGADISDDALTAARSLLDRSDARLVVLHVVPPAESDGDAELALLSAPGLAASEPKWHRLASATPADRTFVEVVCGDPVQEVLDEAERFGSDAIVLGQPASGGMATTWIDRAIAKLVRTVPGRVCLAPRREERARPHHRASPLTRRASSHRRFHVA